MRSAHKATELLQFIWATENGFMKLVNLKEASESDELENIRLISTANFQRSETDKINGRKYGELEDEDETQNNKETPQNKRAKQKKKEEAEKERKADTTKTTKQKKNEITDREKKAKGTMKTSKKPSGTKPDRFFLDEKDKRSFLPGSTTVGRETTQTSADRGTDQRRSRIVRFRTGGKISKTKTN